MSGPTDGLAAPGSSSYNSATMSVGDGTWNSKTNTFLLPNLQGLNFATMQYNGMGNRFSSMPEYHNLIRAHGAIAALVFLFIVPFAIMFNRFYGRQPWFALKVHIWCQILTILLTTVVFILGNIAVGPARALTNPHHAVGLAIYVLVIFQFFSGWLTHRGEKKRRKSYAPVKAVVHMWFGRLTALLGLAQVPLGLTLYGSPSYLFVLYSLVTAALILIYFILSYVQEKNRGMDYESELSNGQEAKTSGRFGRYATAAAAGVGISALTNRLRHRRDVASRVSESTVSEEKYSQYGHRRQDEQQGFTKKNILGFGALAGVFYWIGGKFGKRGNKQDREERIAASPSVLDSAEAAEEGRYGASPGPSPAPHHALNPNPTRLRRTESNMSESSFASEGAPPRRTGGNGLRNTVVGIGSFAFARKFFKNRRARKEDQRIGELRQQELEDERIQRANSRKYTGDGPRRPVGQSVTSTDLTPIGPPMAAGALGNTPTVRPVLPSGGVEDPFISTLAPPPPPHSVGISTQSWESVDGHQHLVQGAPVVAGYPHQNQGAGIAAGAVVGAVAGLVAGQAMTERDRNRSTSQRRTSGGTVNSQPVSVKLNYHNDGRHVTLRRLTEEEAAAERARHSRNRSRRRRTDSASSLSGTEALSRQSDRYRRTPTENLRPPQPPFLQGNNNNNSNPINNNQIPPVLAHNPMNNQYPPVMPMPNIQYTPPPQPQQPSNIPLSFPPPPPIPYTEPRPTPPQLQSSVGSPVTFDGSLTGGSTVYDDNRRRRRAERAAASRERAAMANRAEYT